jgi:hypothetical protein
LATKPKISTRKARAVKSELAKKSDNLQNRVAVIKHNKGKYAYDYGLNNLLPNELLLAIESSVTASSCREIKSTFIKGKGLADKTVASMKVNAYQTANQIVGELADFVGLFRAPVLKVVYNVLGEPYRVYALEFELIRATDDGAYYFNAELANGKDVKKDRVYMDVFDYHESPQSRLKRVKSQIEEHGYQVGDIVYHYEQKAGQKIYPKPVAWAAMEEIESDAALGRLDWRNVKKGFRPDAIMTMIGKIDDVEKDESGRTEQQNFDRELEQFSGEDATPLLVIQVEKKEEAPELLTFDSEKLLNATTEAVDRIGRRVCRGMEVPTILVPGFARASQLGNTDEVLNTMKLFSLTCLANQRLISECLEIVWPQFDWSIDPLELIEETPEWLIAKLTADEIRELGGYAAIEVKEGETGTSTSDALSALSPLVATKVLERMSDEEIRALIGLTMEGYIPKQTPQE